MTQAMAGALLVIVCAVIEGVSQVSFKRAVLLATGRRLWIAAGIFLFIVQALLYTWALQWVEVSTAFPIGSVAFVVIALLSQRMLKEPVTGTRWLGVWLIVLGVGLLTAQA